MFATLNARSALGDPRVEVIRTWHAVDGGLPNPEDALSVSVYQQGARRD